MVEMGKFGSQTDKFDCPDCDSRKFSNVWIENKRDFQEGSFLGFIAGTQCTDCNKRYFSFDALLEFEEALAEKLHRIKAYSNEAVTLIKRANQERAFTS